MKKKGLFLLCLILLNACSPEVGSEKWCSKMKETPKGEWTIDETKAYTKHCLFK